MTTDTTTTTAIPLSKLLQSKDNVRRTGRNDSVADLAASIAAHGLRQNLNVRLLDDGERYEVVAGGRRLRALKQLVRAGQLHKNAAIPCRVLLDGEDAGEISLAENTLRVAMHPDDQFEAFRALADDKGMPVEDIAARFGVAPALVERRMRLARVSPKLRALFRKGELSLDQLMAFAIRDDHDAQERAFRELPQWSRSPRDIRAALTAETVSATDRLARFVGLAAYVEAGGAILRDLFDEEEGGYLSDRTLLLRLAGDKLAAMIGEVQAEGWKWVKAEIEPDHSVSYRRVFPEPADDDAPDTYRPEDMVRAGARIRIGHDGEAQIDRGLVHPNDAADASQPAKAIAAKQPGGLSAVMVEELTAHRTAALRVELARNPAVALAAATHALALPVLYGDTSGGCLALRLQSEALERHASTPGDCPAHATIEAERSRWEAELPAEADAFLPWCLAAPQDTLLALLAFVAAMSVNAVKSRHDRDAGHRLTHADALASALGLDMAKWWQPSVDGFYDKLPKATLLHIVSEAKAPMTVSIGAVKKPEAARYVAQAMIGQAWLPAPLRAA